MAKEFKGTKVHTRYYTSDGTLVPGATTVLSMLPKPALIHWAWQMGLEGEDYRKARDKAADAGTLAHYLIECDIKKQEPDLTMYSPELIDKAENSLLKWYEWRDENKFSPVAVEKKLVSEKHRYGGTLDLLCELNGKLTILDLKTSKGIYPSMYVQLAAYYVLALENGYTPVQASILNIPRSDEGTFEVATITPGQMKELFQGFFLPALQIYNANKQINQKYGWKVV